MKYNINPQKENWMREKFQKETLKLKVFKPHRSEAIVKYSEIWFLNLLFWNLDDQKKTTHADWIYAPIS
jgi:hypothetical protein